MIHGFVQAVLKEVKEKYPHISTPAILRAKITGIQKLEPYEKEVVMEWEGIERQCKIKSFYYSYNLKIISENDEDDLNYPAVPNVKCREQYELGDKVTIALLNGEFNPVIIGG